MPYKYRSQSLEYRRRYYQRRQGEWRAKVAAMKAAAGCATCGEKDPRCLDYHHVDRSAKVASVSRLITTGNWSKLMAEIAKCVVQCANCHRKLHPGDRNG
jgi:hypothetical protein